MDDLREACAEVARRSRSVAVVRDAVAGYAALLPPGAGNHPAADETPGSTREERAAFWLTLDAINFGSGWFPTLRKRDGHSGYGTIAQGWRERFHAHGAWTPDELVALTPARVAEILGQDRAHELMALFARSLTDLGHHVIAEHDGSFAAIADAAGGTAVGLARRLGGWRCFADCSRYQGLELPFLKRAQIAAADLARAGVTEFRDLAELTMFADNLVPHVLRLDGVLRFDPDLVRRIDRGQLIAHGSAEEVEMRACAVHAVELIVAERERSGTPVRAIDIDVLLWHRGGQPAYKAHPRPRSRCTAY